MEDPESFVCLLAKKMCNQGAANYSQLGLKPFINWLFVGYIAATMSTIRLKL
jgi:hypothetical protein